MDDVLASDYNSDELLPTWIYEELIPCHVCDKFNGRTKKGLRLHLLTVHKMGTAQNRLLDSYGRPLDFFDFIDNSDDSPPRFKTTNSKLIPCDVCDEFNGRTNKGLRLHLLTVHKKGIVQNRLLDSYGRPLEIDFKDNSIDFTSLFKAPDSEERYKRELEFALEESAKLAKSLYDDED